jgi:SAM-dependent methyltransferase
MERLLRATAGAESRHFWFRGFRAFVAPVLRRAVACVDTARIIDCGCGTGANVDLLARFGRASGFDLSEAGLRIGREAGRRRLVRGSVASAPFASAAFDVVTSFDVLYALEERDEHAAVSEMYRLLRPGGVAVINVAAMKMLTGDHSILSHERRRYTRASLGQLLTSHGFTIVRLTYTNLALVPPLVLVRAWQRWRGLSLERDADHEIRVPPAPVNAVLTAILLAESLWLRVFDEPFGSSLLCLARKPDEPGR